MGVMDVPAGSDAMKNLSLYLKFEALVFISILPFAYTLKVGVAWHDAGPPLDITDVKFHPYWNMLLGLYTGLGVYQLFASFNPEKFKVLLSFSIYVMRFTRAFILLLVCPAPLLPRLQFLLPHSPPASCVCRRRHRSHCLLLQLFAELHRPIRHRCNLHTTRSNARSCLLACSPVGAAHQSPSCPSCHALRASTFAHRSVAVFGNAGELPATYMGFTNIDKLFVAVPIWLGTGSLMLYFCVKAFGSTLLPWDL